MACYIPEVKIIIKKAKVAAFVTTVPGIVSESHHIEIPGYFLP